MGFAEDIMRGFVFKEIHAIFSRYEGWEMQPVISTENQGFLFQASRYYRGKKQYAYISASLKQRSFPDDVLAAEADPSNRPARVGRFLLVPQGADVSSVPANIRVLSMNSFGFIDGELTWLTKKKNALKYRVGATAEA